MVLKEPKVLKVQKVLKVPPALSVLKGDKDFKVLTVLLPETKVL